MNKEKYERIEWGVVRFEAEDILSTSPFDPDEYEDDILNQNG